MSNNIHLTLKATCAVYSNLNYTLSGTLWNWNDLAFLVTGEMKNNYLKNGQMLI